MDELLEQIRHDAQAARRSLGTLTDASVSVALTAAARHLDKRQKAILEANQEDVAAALERLDEGALDRLRLSPTRLEETHDQLLAMAALAPIEREIDSWTLENGLRVSARRIPIGVVGANFEARPAVAVDVAAQLLKSLNACVLRTGSAALQTVTALVDRVLRPALEDAGLAPELVQLVRSPERAGAEALVSLPKAIPLVILRGSGRTTAELTRIAAGHGVRTLAHSEGGGVLYVDRSADIDRAMALIDSSLDRLGVCNRLNLLLVHEQIDLQPLVERLRERGVDVCGTVRARVHAKLAVLEGPLGHEWANDPERVATVSVDVVESLEEAVELANTETSGLAAGIVSEDEEAAAEFLSTYRGTAAFWHAPTRFTDGHALTGAPETGINVDWAPGPRGPVTYRDLWLRQLQVIGDGSQRR